MTPFSAQGSATVRAGRNSSKSDGHSFSCSPSTYVKAIDDAAIQTEMSVLGRFLVTKKENDIASFKTPNLRNVLVTSPYFHDGSQQTLWDVVDHYNKGDGLQNRYLDQDIQPLALTEPDIDDLVAFLASLTSPDYKEARTKMLWSKKEIDLQA